MESYSKNSRSVCCAVAGLMLACGSQAAEVSQYELPPLVVANDVVPEALKKRDCATTEAWAQHKEAVERGKTAMEAMRTSDAFVAQKALYDAYVALEVSTVRSFFQCTAKKKWALDVSIATDGVSVSLQFSRTVQRKAGGSKEKKALKRKADAATVPRGEDGMRPLAVVDYDVELSTYMEGTNVCILGLDPGRCNLATVTYLRRMMRNGKLREYSSTWKLQRTDYRHKSLTVMQDKLQRYRADKAGLLAEWSHLGEGEAALNTVHCADMVSYLEGYSTLQERWWDLALQRRESRSNFQRYIGKRSVLDGFFGGIKKQMTKLHPGVGLRVAYGSAGPTMKPGGRGEQSVPTTGTYASCKRIFDTVLTDEFRSTCADWASGKRNELVFETPDGIGGRYLDHTLGKHSPCVPLTHKDWGEVAKWRADGAHKQRPFQARPTHLRSVALRYPEVRGLRFDNESGKYHDRDRSAALSIARLQCLHELGRPRPQPFSRSYRLI